MKYAMRGQTMKGFTLIEFLVASVLAMIVITAAGSTYFMTRRLGDAAQKRLAVQSNLRTVTTHIMRDARMAGSFGCYNTSSIIDGWQAPNFEIAALPLASPGSGSSTNVLKLDGNADNMLGVHWGKVGSQDALVFVYGLSDTPVVQADGLTAAPNNTLRSITLGKAVNNNMGAIDPLRQALNNQGNIVLSSCRAAYGMNLQTKVSGDSINFQNALSNVNFTESDKGELSVTQLYAAAYIHDKTNKRLLRMDLDSSSKWQSPQVVAEGINSMDIAYGYADDCSWNTFDADPKHVKETFTFTRSMKTTKDKGKMPAILEVKINYDLDTEQKDITTAKTTADYVINATVRGGNVCGNRTPVDI